MARTIEIGQTITVSNLAQQLELPAASLISELVKNGVMLTLNERIDFDTVSILIEELGLDVKVKQKDVATVVIDKERVGAVSETRPPVVAVMGHVDHGKTSLLDKIRGSDRVATEAGGITQHISAQQVVHKDRKITFLDTPGHEAFAAVREHGAVLTDLIVLIVAADDGIKDQTVEAIRFAKKSGVKIVVAISKMDLPTANIHLVKQQLAEHELLAEELGGQTICVPVSSKTGEGIEELLDMILLSADIDDLQADSRGTASGLVIESSMKQGLGPAAVVLVQEGILRKGDFLVAGGAWGKVRLLQDMASKPVDQATASTPVTVSGFKTLPEFGMAFEVFDTEKAAKRQADSVARQHDFKSTGMSSRELLRIIDRRAEIKEHNAIIKADVRGSLTAVLDGLKSLDTDEVATRIVDSGVGSLGESDISKANISQATVYCFNINVSVAMRRLAAQAGVDLRTYSVIYELLADIKAALEKLLPPEIITVERGSLQIKGIFKTSRKELICGGKVVKGTLKLPSTVRILRSGEKLAEAEVESLAKGQTAVQEVANGEMCGVKLATQTKINLKEDDVLEFYHLETKERQL